MSWFSCVDDLKNILKDKREERCWRADLCFPCYIGLHVITPPLVSHLHGKSSLTSIICCGVERSKNRDQQPTTEFPAINTCASCNSFLCIIPSNSCDTGFSMQIRKVALFRHWNHQSVCEEGQHCICLFWFATTCCPWRRFELIFTKGQTSRGKWHGSIEENDFHRGNHSEDD